jgi:hypothetical protein
LCAIRKSGCKDWKQQFGYHIRSLAETTMFRLKSIFGEPLICSPDRDANVTNSDPLRCS